MKYIWNRLADGVMGGSLGFLILMGIKESNFTLIIVTTVMIACYTFKVILEIDED